MIRKLLILVLAVGFTSVASAAVTEFSLQTDGLVLDVVGVAGVSVPTYYIVSGTVIDMVYPQNPITYPDIVGDMADCGVTEQGGVTYAYITVFEGFGFPKAGKWFTFDIYDVSTDGWTVGQTVDTLDILDSTATKIGTLNVTSTVPEPATLLLLGLGAVMMRRKHSPQA